MPPSSRTVHVPWSTPFHFPKPFPSRPASVLAAEVAETLKNPNLELWISHSNHNHLPSGQEAVQQAVHQAVQTRYTSGTRADRKRAKSGPFTALNRTLSTFPAFVLLLATLLSSAARDAEVTYTNFSGPGPNQIYLVRVPRRDPSLQIHSIHSGGKPIGRSRITEQLALTKHGTPIAAINGDFFELSGPFAGDPRGLQIVNGSLISAPTGNATFWIDSSNSPHIAITRSDLKITWPNGRSSPITLNAPCRTNDITLYTSDAHAPRGQSIAREIVLTPPPAAPNSSLRANHSYNFTIREIRPATNIPIPPNSFLLTIGSDAKSPLLSTGAVVKISTATIPNLRDATHAISGGPILITAGKQRIFTTNDSNATRNRHILQKHPRTALGFSQNEFIWLIVDGRRNDSVGMDLNELGALMVELGCHQAMNLDGGGSSTLWFDGKVRNQPSDGAERPIANSLILVRKPPPQ